MGIFKAYDIRGIYGKELTDEIAEKIAKAFSNFMHAKKIVVGMDVRNSSPKLKEAVIRGLLSQGCSVTDIGIAPIPAFFYSIIKHKMKAGIFITGSHDEVGYNGLKLCGPGANDLTYEKGISKIEKLYKRNFKLKPGGTVASKDVLYEYKKQLAKKFRATLPLSVVVDAGNGCFSKVAPDLLEKVGFKVTRLFCEYDGSFPNRHPEPLDVNLKSLKSTVLETKSDLGIAFDADGDRVIFVDDKGRTVRPDLILILFAKEMLRKNDSLIATISCTKDLNALAKKYGWKLSWVRVGRSYVKRMMHATNAALGGEISGHYFFKKNYSYDDGLYAALIMLSILTREGVPLSYLEDKTRTSPFIEMRIDCAEKRKAKVISRLKKKFRKNKLTLIDGVGITFRGGFALVRPSNTEEKLEIKVEAATEDELNEIKKSVFDVLKSVR